MKIRKRQNRLYELFNGRNKVRYVAVSLAYIHLYVIFVLYNIFNPWSFELCGINILLSFIILIRIFLKNSFKRFYYPRFNPRRYYNFAKSKFSFRKKQSVNLKVNEAILATKKYIDRHYSHMYNADILLLELKNVKTNYDIYTQLPSNFIVGIVTGVVSTSLTGIILEGEGAAIIFNSLANIIISIGLSFFSLLILYYAIKSFYLEYASIIMPYEIKIIRKQLSNIDDIYFEQ